MATTCETCTFFNASLRRCGAYGMPAERARAIPTLCGDAGADHKPVPNPLMQPMDWLALALFALIALSAIVGTFIEPGAVARLMAVLA